MFDDFNIFLFGSCTINKNAQNVRNFCQLCLFISIYCEDIVNTPSSFWSSIEVKFFFSLSMAFCLYPFCQSLSIWWYPSLRALKGHQVNLKPALFVGYTSHIVMKFIPVNSLIGYRHFFVQFIAVKPKYCPSTKIKIFHSDKKKNKMESNVPFFKVTL